MQTVFEKSVSNNLKMIEFWDTVTQHLEAKGGRFLQVQGQSGLHSEFQINLEYSDMLSQQINI